VPRPHTQLLMVIATASREAVVSWVPGETIMRHFTSAERVTPISLWLAVSPYLSGIFFTGLHTVAENCALGDVEVM
jgi:hypothetical protein